MILRGFSRVNGMVLSYSLPLEMDFPNLFATTLSLRLAPCRSICI